MLVVQSIHRVQNLDNKQTVVNINKKYFHHMKNILTCREAGTMTPGVSCPWPELTAPTTRQMFSTAVPTWEEQQLKIIKLQAYSDSLTIEKRKV